MTYVFCKRCAECMEDNEPLKTEMLRLAKNGYWICPHMKSMCGTPKGTKLQ